ncbi:MAG TPA: glucose-6-phosphate dehydrogenase, partial [Methylomirabilota bacterium]|nr:glucose-6-phosphate dehydrogenase [Methylomirabilota bacterium]
MATGLRPAPPCTFVIFGAAGDLTKRKLLPALYNLKAVGLLPRRFAIVGVTRKEKTHEEFREEQTKDIHEFATQRLDEALWDELRGCLYYQAGEFTDPAMYTKLEALLKEVSKTHGTGDNVLFYLATPPDFFGEIVKRLGETGLSRQGAGTWRRVVVEKPFGRDLDSARALNAELSRVLEENQIFRIDHYLGKETVQNIMVFRFANGFLEPVWNRNYVDHVQIMVAETVGVEDRGNYYDKAGVVRDMMQNHMLQLLALVAMEPPAAFDDRGVRDEKVKVLRALRRIRTEEMADRAVRAQYDAGFIEGTRVAGYRGE